ncbi:hypothetical protein ACFWFI_02120 [Streptomyces sp. NPDC060209]|uniref:hypothetical protein n=1 Tax=Streptomyces sp. NPDC060209 TaxID=3347073 RepID=UPI0036603F4E
MSGGPGLSLYYAAAKDDDYRNVLSLDFGTPVDLTGTVVGLTVETGDFPRD